MRANDRQPASRMRWTELRRVASWHRRLLAAGLAAGSVAVGLQALAPADPPTARVLAAARDLTTEVPLAADDLVVLDLPLGLVPDGALDSAADLIGRTVSGPVRAGEPLTDVRLIGPALVGALGPGVVAAPVRVADAETTTLVRPGDRIDVLATPVSMESAGQPTRTLASDVAVLAVPAREARGFEDGALLIIATTEAQAASLAQAVVNDRLSIILRGADVP